MKGFTLIEVMIALSLVAFGALATTKLVGSVVTSNHASESRMNTAAIAQGILDREAALMRSGNGVPAAVVRQPYIAGDMDILYSLTATVLNAFAGPPPVREVHLRVDVFHPALTAGSASVETVVMAVGP